MSEAHINKATVGAAAGVPFFPMTETRSTATGLRICESRPHARKLIHTCHTAKRYVSEAPHTRSGKKSHTRSALNMLKLPLFKNSTFLRITRRNSTEFDGIRRNSTPLPGQALIEHMPQILCIAQNSTPYGLLEDVLSFDWIPRAALTRDNCTVTRPEFQHHSRAPTRFQQQRS